MTFLKIFSSSLHFYDSGNYWRWADCHITKMQGISHNPVNQHIAKYFAFSVPIWVVEKCTPFYKLMIIKDLQKAMQFSHCPWCLRIARYFTSDYKSALYKTACNSHYLRSSRKLHSFLHTPGNQRFTNCPAILKNSEASRSFGCKDFHSPSWQSCRRARISRVRRESL